MFGEKVACASIFPHLQIQTWSYVTSVYISITISITLQSQSHTFCNMCTYSHTLHSVICQYSHTLHDMCTYITNAVLPASIVIH